MADQSHTPGPWSRSREYGVVASDGRGICSTGGYQNNQVDPEELQAESMANADLIAAAPDLLAALRAMVGIVEDSSGVVDYRGNGNFAPWSELPQLAKALAAIAKAEGGDHD